MSDDSALLQRIAAGHRRALEDFYRRHEGRVYAFALKRLGDPALAAEVLNEVMLTVWRDAGRFQGRSRVTTWLLGIANHKCLDALRRRGRDTLLEPLEEAQLPPEEGENNTAAALAALDDAELLRYCLERLPEAQRAVVHLAFFEDLPYGEVAAAVDCPVGTVKSRMLHAKRALGRCLQRAGLAMD